jgi:hypothetical protein
LGILDARRPGADDPDRGRGELMAERDDSPEARAHALITRILGLVQECRAILPELEPPAAETPGAQAERHLYMAPLGVLADGLVRTVDEALVMLRPRTEPPSAALLDGC